MHQTIASNQAQSIQYAKEKKKSSKPLMGAGMTEVGRYAKRRRLLALSYK